MATEHRQQLNVRINPRLPRLLKLRAERVRNAARAYGSGAAGRETAPTRDAFIAGLARDMRELVKEFEQSFETGCR